MAGIIEFPQIVQEALSEFGDLFSNEPQRRRFAEYCQLRDDQGQTRHMNLVMLAYSLLMRQLKQSHAWEWACCQLTTVGEACRAIVRETLRKTLTWAMEHVKEWGWEVPEVIAHLNLGPTPCTL
jgi:hypothetical protein